MILEQLSLFDIQPRVHLFILVPKNQRTEIICKNCSSMWVMIQMRQSWDGTTEYLLQNKSSYGMRFWVRLENDPNFWIERHYTPTDENILRQEHVDKLIALGIVKKREIT